MTIGDAHPAKPLSVSIGLMVMSGNTHDGKHMLEIFGQVREDLTDGSTNIRCRCQQQDCPGKNRRRQQALSDQEALQQERRRDTGRFPGGELECIDAEKGILSQEGLSVEGELLLLPRELHNLEKKGVEKRARKKLKEAKDLQRDLEQGKKLKKRYRIDNVLIKATISLQTKPTEITEEEALRRLLEKGTMGRERFFSLVSDRDMDPREAWSKYRSKDVVEKPFSSMKSDIGIDLFAPGQMTQLTASS